MSNKTIIKFYQIDLKNIRPNSKNGNTVLTIHKNQIIEKALPVAELTCNEPLKTYEVTIRNYQPKSIASLAYNPKNYQSIQGVLYSCDNDLIKNITINSIQNNNKNIEINNVTQWQDDSFLIDKDFQFIDTSNYVFIPYYPNKKDGEQLNLSANEFNKMLFLNTINNQKSKVSQTDIPNDNNMGVLYGIVILMVLIGEVTFLLKKVNKHNK